MMQSVEEDECNELTISPVIDQVRQEALIINTTQESSLVGEHEDNLKADPIWKRFIKSSILHAVIFIIFFIIAIPTLIFLFVVENDPPLRIGLSSCSVDPGYRVSCGHTDISRSYCLSIRCCHDEERRQCYHYIPSKYGYSTGEQDEVTPGIGGGSTTGRFLASPKYTTLGTLAVKELKLTVQEIDGDRVKVILHEPTDVVEEIKITELKRYTVGIYEDFLAVKIHRSDASKDLLLTTVLGPLMASEHYWEWTFQLTSAHLFGMGGLLIEPDTVINKTFYPNRKNHILQQPMFLAHTRGQWHSVLVDWVGGPLEVTILPSKLAVLRMVGGGRIELTLGVGPDPRQATKQLRLTEENMIVPPRWILGLHMCRDGVTTLKEAIVEYVNFHLHSTLQFATDCIHENLFLMFANDDPDESLMKKFDQTLQKRVFNNILLSIPAQIPVGSTLFDEASTLDILYKNGTENEYVNASYNGLQVAYPDYEAESIKDYIQIVEKIVNAIHGFTRPIVGFVLRDNWPDAENIHFQDEHRFPYMTQGLTEALSYTLPYTSSSKNRPTSHYLSHRTYSTAHLSFIRAIAVSNPSPQEPLLYITPTTPSPSLLQSHNLYAHLQHVNATWEELRRVIHYSVYHSIFGVGGTGLVTAPVCGSGALWNGDLQEELCTRWWLYAATTPLVRVSSGGLRRDPESLPSKTSQSTVLRALRHRTALLPYYYTTLTQGEPLLRPVFYDYPHDENTFALDEQYLLGDALLIAQPLTPKMVVQRVYLPRREECGGWYEYWSGTLFDDVLKGTNAIEGQWIELPIIASDWIMFIASGKIVPRAKESSENTFNLLLATGKESCPIAKGEMRFIKQSLYFEADQSQLTISNIIAVKAETCLSDGPIGFHIIEKIYVYSRVTANIQLALAIQDLCNYNDDTLILNIYNVPPINTP